LPYMLVVLRIRRGWTEERALTTPKLTIGAQPGHPYHGRGRSHARKLAEANVATPASSVELSQASPSA